MAGEFHAAGETLPVPDSEFLLMLLADARLPTGAHTQSAGLEPALRGGMSIADVPAYIDARLRTITTVEAGAAVLARHRAISHGADLRTQLGRVDEAWRARTTSPALRENAELMGRGYLRLLRTLWPDHPAVLAAARLSAPTRAVALGVAAAAAGLSPRQLVSLVAYDDVQTIAAAALKLHPMDPAEATRWVIGAAPAVARMVSALSTMTAIDELPACAAPLIEQWAEQHATATQRLFRA